MHKNCKTEIYVLLIKGVLNIRIHNLNEKEWKLLCWAIALSEKLVSLYQFLSDCSLRHDALLISKMTFQNYKGASILYITLKIHMSNNIVKI